MYHDWYPKAIAPCMWVVAKRGGERTDPELVAGTLVRASEAGRAPLFQAWCYATGDGRDLLYVGQFKSLTVAMRSVAKACPNPVPYIWIGYEKPRKEKGKT